MPMTDAPNFGTKFGRWRPCLRYIGPSLGTTCGASVERGDYTPPFLDAPPCSAPPVGGGLRPAPWPSLLRLTPISVGSRMPFGPRRGGPMCPPVDGSCEEPCPGRHIGRPLQNLYLPPQTGRGRSPAPTGLSWCQAAGRQSRTPAPAKAAQPDRSARDPRPAIPRRAHSQLSILNFPPKPSACPGSGPGQALFSRIVLGDGFPENEAAHGFAVEGDEGVEVAPPGDGLAGGKQDHDTEEPQPKAPEVEGRREQQQ